MPSRRAAIRMSPEETSAYLASRHKLILVSNGPQGLPHAVPMNYGLDAQGRICVTSFKNSQKVKNLERDRRATFLVESGVRYDQLQGVMAYCDAEIVHDLDQIRDFLGMLSRNEAVTGGIKLQNTQAQLAKRVLLRLTPFQMTSWDHRKLGGVY